MEDKRNNTSHEINISSLQTNGKKKIVNTCVEGYLRCYYSDNQSQWVNWFPLVEWSYNTTYHTYTRRLSPSESLYGYPTRSITSFLHDDSKVQEANSHIKKTNETLKILKENLQMA